MVTSSHTCTQKCNLQAEVVNGFGGEGERHLSLPVIHAHKNATYKLKLLIDLEEKGKGIDRSFPVIYMHTKHNSPVEVDNGLG